MRGQEAPGRLVLDARGLTFASPLELTGLVAHAHAAAHHGELVEVLTPADRNVASYLERMDVIGHLADRAFVRDAPPGAPRFDRITQLTEVTHVTTHTADVFIDRLSRMIFDYLDPALRKAAFFGVGELVDNAISHGSSEPGAFAAAQLYSGRTSTYAGMEFAICDTGVGVLSHLRRNPRYEHLHDAPAALACALQPGVSGTNDPRGYGLHDLLSTNDGYVRLVLRSGAGIASVVARPSHGARPQAVDWADPVPGTWAWLRVRNP